MLHSCVLVHAPRNAGGSYVQSVVTGRASAVLVPTASAAATSNPNTDTEMSFRSFDIRPPSGGGENFKLYCDNYRLERPVTVA